MTTNQPTSTNGNNETAQFLAPQAPTTAGDSDDLNVLYANPYDIEARGFRFTSLEDYNAKYAANRNGWGGVVEEYSIEFLDGNDEDSDLFAQLRVNQGTLSTWFDLMDRDLSTEQKAALAWLVGDRGAKLDDALDQLDDVMIQCGELNDVGGELFEELYAEELGKLPEALRYYFDSDAWTRDAKLNGDFDTITFGGHDYVITNANQF
ncbi:hypothetical protein BBJ41_00870 [Burkholderia stabilis]|uniref:antirestriction protein ArdA n=1 Tax=Burkholderia cepacia complex TaxID=87882 RepID=UPI0008516796|nr:MULTISPECIES: antirestriction protein ArdA [Burkholderia cepacia complex]AOR66218.1 hypothetical protein BBJ41_00870 [Burkholderia stabilis]MBR8042133.1 antirestriction protein ArdA [Burkholderia cenocepacia]HDR9491976.1 antirestriction protein ArdA [Burkholderia stabilis]HDR9523990.1 antirestriction protein ArdA [Burkholderia stabilis]HDR9530703.1 antirestriction protein ArdA [Burkholderia stabilis]